MGLAPGKPRRLREVIVERFQEIFGAPPEVVARAPGRIEFIGNHTDYNGGSVIGAAIDLEIRFSARSRTDGKIRIVSRQMDCEVSVEAGRLQPFAGASAWANYVLGVREVLLDAGYPVAGGFSGLVSGDLPAGAGMSSSAALELSAAYAITALHEIEIERAEMIKLCRRAENDFVGVPCGMLDQTVSAFGGRDRLVHIDCATERITPVPHPPGCAFWIFDTGVKHALVDSKYAERHRECTAAYEVLKRAGSRAPFLALVEPSFVHCEKQRLGDTLYRRAVHVTEENGRVESVTSALGAGDLDRTGDLLYASHQSSQLNFENSCEELDFLVDRLKAVDGVYGARLSGGGFGGAVMAFAAVGGDISERAAIIAEQFLTRFGNRPTIFSVELGEPAGLSD